MSVSYCRAIVLLSILASCFIATFCRADELTLADKGMPKAAIIVGDKSSAPVKKIAEVLAARIARRAGCQLPIRAELETPGGISTDNVDIVIGTPAGNALIAKLCERFNRTVPTLENVGPGGFVLYALKEGEYGWIIVSGSDAQGTICGVGKLLRRIDFAEGRARLSPMNFIEKIDPDHLMRVQQQKPPQWGNAFMDAPVEWLKEYIEDMALWGSTDFVTLGFLWTLDNPLDPNADAESRRRLKKVTDLAVYAGQLGMKVGYYIYPNTVYRNEIHLRKLGGKFRYRQDACPSIPEVRKVLLKDRENLFKYAKRTGVDLSYTINSAYDFGGCDCPKCEPWISTHIELSKEVHDIARKYFPEIKVFFTTWAYKPEEKKILLGWLERDKPAWVAGVINRPALALPAPYESVGWQTIFACGPREVYGRMGSDPLPVFLPKKLKEFHDNGIRYIHTYSEGICDDINNAVIARMCRRPLDLDARETLEEYCHDRFGTDWKDSAALARLILNNFHHAKAGRFNASLRVESPGEVLSRLEEIEERMPSWAKDDWRWRIFKTRVRLEALDQKGEWLPEVYRILTDAAKRGDEGEMTAAIDRAVARLRTIETISPQDTKRWKDEAEQLTSHLYNDLYRTPRRYKAHGEFRLRPKLLSLTPLVIQRLERAKSMSGPDNKRDALNALSAELKSLGRKASRLNGGKPILRPKSAATITGANLTGGRALPASDKSPSLVALLKGGARAIGSASSKFDTIRCQFEFETGEESLGKSVKLIVSGSNRSAGDAAVVIRLNGHVVFNGPSRFSKDDFSEVSYSVPSEWIQDGTNELEIQNLVPTGNREILVDSVTLNAN